jgi:RNA polymerase sigma factor (TIGR02999 family)
MRQILVDHARRRTSAKRGGHVEHTDLDTLDLADASAEQALDLDAALTALARRDEDLARLVEWHFFAGLSFVEIAAELGRHERTVRHDWELARAFLRQAMTARVRP